MSILEKKDGFHVGLYLLGDDVKLLWTTIFFPLFFYLLFFFLSLKLGSSCIVAWLLTYLDLSLFSILLLLLLLLLLLVLSLSLPLSLSLSLSLCLPIAWPLPPLPTKRQKTIFWLGQAGPASIHTGVQVGHHVGRFWFVVSLPTFSNLLVKNK